MQNSVNKHRFFEKTEVSSLFFYKNFNVKLKVKYSIRKCDVINYLFRMGCFEKKCIENILDQLINMN